MRMCDLAEQAQLSRSGLTRLVDRLEREGLLERCTCEHDARGAYACLTERGRERLGAARVTHLDRRPGALPLALLRGRAGLRSRRCGPDAPRCDLLRDRPQRSRPEASSLDAGRYPSALSSARDRGRALRGRRRRACSAPRADGGGAR